MSTSFSESFLGWAKVLSIGIPVWIIVEFAGTKFFDLPVFSRLSSSLARLSSTARIVVVTTIVVLVISLFIFGVNLVKHGYQL
jgi:hypothetical protein